MITRDSNRFGECLTSTGHTSLDLRVGTHSGPADQPVFREDVRRSGQARRLLTSIGRAIVLIEQPKSFLFYMEIASESCEIKLTEHRRNTHETVRGESKRGNVEALNTMPYY
jgi:hypothetical protein